MTFELNPYLRGHLLMILPYRTMKSCPNNLTAIGGILFILGTDVHRQGTVCCGKQLLTLTHIFKFNCSWIYWKIGQRTHVCAIRLLSLEGSFSYSVQIHVFILREGSSFITTFDLDPSDNKIIKQWLCTPKVSNNWVWGEFAELGILSCQITDIVHKW